MQMQTEKSTSLSKAKLFKTAEVAAKKIDKANTGALKEMLRNEATCAVACDLAAKQLLGDYSAWEPESIWMELGNQGVELPDLNKSKILAALTLKFMPSFYWDGIVLEHTAMAFNDILSNPNILHEATPGQLSWATYEAEMIRTNYGESVPDFQHEPVAYTAVVLHRAGFVVAPEPLEFAQELLDKINLSSDNKEAITKAWKALDKETLKDHAFPETAVGVQLARLATVHIYLEDRKRQCAEDLAAFR